MPVRPLPFPLRPLARRAVARVRDGRRRWPARLAVVLAASGALPAEAVAQATAAGTPPAAAVPAIPPAEFATRRDSLAARLDSGVVLAFGGRTPVADFGPFFQLPAFRYLTDYREPDAAFVLVAQRGRPRAAWLFSAPVPARRAMYYGARPDSLTLARTLGLTLRPMAQLDAVMDSLVRAGLPLHHLADFAAADFAVQDSLTRGRAFVRALTARHPGLVVRDAHPVVDALRARKSAAELALIRRAAEVTSAGHVAAMLLPDPKFEYELQAELEYTFLRLGGARPAYGSIVGAGERGTQLHYMKDRDPVRPGQLVVMDAATEYEGYAGDVTRTIPVSGTFTPEQRALYQLVREALAAAERNSQPGMPAQAALDSAVAVRAAGLARLGLIDSVGAVMDPPWPADCARTPQQCRQSQLWMIHGISHGIGLEVHDPAQFYTGARVFRPGDAFTIEPGLYVSRSFLDALPDTPRNRAWKARVLPVVRRYEGTGVRLEDDYIVTPTGLERISTAPRELEEVEALMRQRRPRVLP